MKSNPILSAALFILILSISAIAEDEKSGKSPVFTEARKSKIESMLIETSKNINRGLPVMVDEGTRLDVTLAVGMQMHYRYTLIDEVSENLDTKKFRQIAKAKCIKNQLADKGAILLLRAGVEYNYLYSDKNGILIASILINKKICDLE